MDVLQIYNSHSCTWESIHGGNSVFVVNVGDCLRDWTSRVFTSTLHRVITLNKTDRSHSDDCSRGPGGKEYTRRSLAYFVGPNPIVNVSPIKIVKNVGESKCNIDIIGSEELVCEGVDSILTYERWRQHRVREAMKQMKK